MTIQWKNGKVDRDAMRVTPTGEYADALDECVAALRFYATSEWEPDYPGGICYQVENRCGKMQTVIDTGDNARSVLNKLGVEP